MMSRRLTLDVGVQNCTLGVGRQRDDRSFRYFWIRSVFMLKGKTKDNNFFTDCRVRWISPWKAALSSMRSFNR